MLILHLRLQKWQQHCFKEANYFQNISELVLSYFEPQSANTDFINYKQFRVCYSEFNKAVFPFDLAIFASVNAINESEQMYGHAFNNSM